MICPILTVNPAGEYIMDNWISYSEAINNCRYFDYLFNGKSIVMDRFTIEYIDYNKYNSLPVLYNYDHSLDRLGVINIHDFNVLFSYTKKHSEDTFILSILPDFYYDMDRYTKLYLISDETLKGHFGDDETEYFDYNKWMRKNYPVYQDDTSTVYCFINIPRILGLYSMFMKRPLYEYEKKIIIDNFTSDDDKVKVPPYFPIINI